MTFADRRDAGRQLARLLSKYKGQEVVVYALPRGGVTVAVEIAKFLHAPLDLILAHKIGHPLQPEYAIAAVSESGHMIGNDAELSSVNQEWLQREKEEQMREIKRKRQLYLKGRKEISPQNKIAIIVDDGIATGLTMQAGIFELKDKHPKAIVAAVPVAPRHTVQLLKSMIDEVVGVEIPDNFDFLGAVGAYYNKFYQVEDEEVISILEDHAKEMDE